MKNPTLMLRRATTVAHTTVQRPALLIPSAGFEAAALFAMHDGYAVKPDRVRVSLYQGCAVLTGSVQWQYQKEGATRCVLAMDGVVSVSNLLTLLPNTPPITQREG